MGYRLITSGTTESSIMGGWLQKMTSINQHDRGRTLLGKKREIRGNRDNEYDGREWGICPDGGWSFTEACVE